jgi:hypothetical protein
VWDVMCVWGGVGWGGVGWGGVGWGAGGAAPPRSSGLHEPSIDDKFQLGLTASTRASSSSTPSGCRSPAPAAAAAAETAAAPPASSSAPAPLPLGAKGVASGWCSGQWAPVRQWPFFCQEGQTWIGSLQIGV